MADKEKDEDLVEKAAQELGSYGDASFANICLTAGTAMDIIGLLQLCTRHPHLPERQKEFAKKMVSDLSRAFKPEHTAIAELIKRGWAQEHDVEVSA